MRPTSLEQPTRPARRDWLLVGGLLLLTVLPYAASGRVALSLVGLAATSPLLLRRVHPTPVFLVVAVATLAQVPFSETLQAFDVALMVALYATVDWVTDRRQLVLVGAICGLGALVAGWDWDPSRANGDPPTPGGISLGVVGCLTVTAAVAALGLAARRRRELMIELRGRAIDAERERDQHALLAAQTERTRIAREMHDVIAHALAVIVVQSDGASYAVRHSDSPAVAAQALDTIGDTSRHALAETRRLVGALREEGEQAELAPSFGAADIESLVDGVREAGLSVNLHSDDLGDVPPAAGAAAYRVVQESLTNVIKHAGGGATASVEVERDDRELRLRVLDTGHGQRPQSDDHRGYGLVGMRERVTVLGGSLFTGNHRGGGFVVEANIPCEDTEHDAHD